MSPFYVWLQQQSTRGDLIGRFAHCAVRDESWPQRSWRLHVLLAYLDVHHARWHREDDWRTALKVAHREWRRTRGA